MIIRLARRKITVAVGKIYKPLQIFKLLVLYHIINISENGTEIRAAEAFELHCFQIFVKLLLRSYLYVLLNGGIALNYAET